MFAAQRVPVAARPPVQRRAAPDWPPAWLLAQTVLAKLVPMPLERVVAPAQPVAPRPVEAVGWGDGAAVCSGAGGTGPVRSTAKVEEVQAANRNSRTKIK